MRFERVNYLLDFLFLWDDGQERRGWGNKPYRAILQKSFELIERRLGYRRADKWLDEFFHLVRLTHWVLPYPSDSALIMSTKTSRKQGLKGRMMWFSAVYADPERVALPFTSHPTTLYRILRNAERETFGSSSSGRDPTAWGASQLITACRAQGLEVYGQKETDEFWVAGKRSIGLKGFAPVWERTQPPRLRILEQTKNRSLDELEDVMSGFSREFADADVSRTDVPASRDSLEPEGEEVDEQRKSARRWSRSASTGKSIMTAFAQRSRNERSHGGASDGSMTALTIHSGSIFIPSSSER
jgi:hypothetical protein